jgi:hypothetical protein
MCPAIYIAQFKVFRLQVINDSGMTGIVAIVKEETTTII